MCHFVSKLSADGKSFYFKSGILFYFWVGAQILSSNIIHHLLEAQDTPTIYLALSRWENMRKYSPKSIHIYVNDVSTGVLCQSVIIQNTTDTSWHNIATFTLRCWKETASNLCLLLKPIIYSNVFGLRMKWGILIRFCLISLITPVGLTCMYPDYNGNPLEILTRAPKLTPTEGNWRSCLHNQQEKHLSSQFLFSYLTWRSLSSSVGTGTRRQWRTLIPTEFVGATIYHLFLRICPLHGRQEVY